MKYNKYDLIKIISDDTGFYKNEIEEVVNSIIKNLPQMLETDDELHIGHFGKFVCKVTNERIGINPQTQKKILIQPKKVLKFKCSKELYSGENNNKSSSEKSLDE